MAPSESVESFHQQQNKPANLVWQHESGKSGQFNVYDVENFCVKDLTFNRRDFYKISLLTGDGRLDYASRSIRIDRPALVFSNPRVPYAYEMLSAKQGGYFCLFTEDFLMTNGRSTSLQESPLFRIGSDPVFFVDESGYSTLAHLFRQMLTERNSAYRHKNDLLRTYVTLLLHEAMKIQPQANQYQYQNATHRIAALFTDLLDRQFPIDSPDRALSLRTASDFADCLSVHVNHLNRAVREVTGKTTTTHIAERVIGEARALLQYTDWPIGDIAHALGFDYPTYFNNFFKRHTGLTPRALRS